MAFYYGASDLDAMLAEFGVPVVLGQWTGTGIVDTTDQDLLAAEASHFVGKVMAVVVKTGVLVGLAEGATLEVDGTSYRVIQAHQQDDGALTRVLCSVT